MKSAVKIPLLFLPPGREPAQAAQLSSAKCRKGQGGGRGFEECDTGQGRTKDCRA